MCEENKALARRWADIFNEGNLDLVDEIYAPDYVGHDPAMPEDVRGVEGAREFASMYRTAFPDVQLSVEDQVAEGDMVVTRWIASGNHQGELMGIAPTGNRVRVTGTSVERVVDGKIEETWDNYDALGMMQQIGAIPSPQETQA
jgi:steroid delta-isomerase-like uncharacterized protein